MIRTRRGQNSVVSTSAPQLWCGTPGYPAAYGQSRELGSQVASRTWNCKKGAAACLVTAGSRIFRENAHRIFNWESQSENPSVLVSKSSYNRRELSPRERWIVLSVRVCDRRDEWPDFTPIDSVFFFFFPTPHVTSRQRDCHVDERERESRYFWIKPACRSPAPSIAHSVCLIPLSPFLCSLSSPKISQFRAIER